MTALPETPVSRADYLAFERGAVERHQLWDGEVFPMVAAFLAHERIVGNVFAELRVQLRGTECEPLLSNLRVRIPNRDRYVYPDVTIACGGVRLEDEHADVLLNPRVIFEVLSDSTERFDRGDKFAGYRSVTSFTDYVLVAQDRPSVEHFRRQDDGTWLLRVIEQGELSLEGPAVALALDDVYSGVLPP